MTLLRESSLRTKSIIVILSVAILSTLPLVLYYRTTFEGLLSVGIGSDTSIDSAIALALENAETDADKENALTAYRSYHQAIALKGTLLKEIRTFTLLYIAAVILIAAAAGWFLITRITKPLKNLTSTMRNTERDMTDTKIVFKKSADEIVTLSTVFDDMTRRLKKAKQKELLAERRHAWEQVARVLAHEIKNPLTPIKLSTERLYDRYLNGASNLNEVMESTTKTVLAEISNLERLVDSFRQYARFPEPVMDENSLRDLITEVTSLYGDKDIKFDIYGTEMLPILTFDLGQIRQVISNIVKNGIEASRSAKRDNVIISINAFTSRTAVSVSFKDNGKGIPEEIMERIFQPNFTTKAEGSGIGLALSERILALHGGTISAANAPEGGAEFRITLPKQGTI